MIANGSSLETVDNLNIEDARHLYSALRLGLWGPFKDYRQTYFQLAKQNELAELQRAIAMGKKFKATPFARYHEIFPTIEDAETLGTARTARQIQQENSMATNAALALGGNMPEWMRNQI